MFKGLGKIKLKLQWFVIMAIVIGVILLFISSSLRIDIGNILFGIAAIGLVYVLYQYLEHKKKPQKTVNISLKILIHLIWKILKTLDPISLSKTIILPMKTQN